MFNWIIWPVRILPSLASITGKSRAIDLPTPKTLPQDGGPTAYIVNTDPHDEPKMHWIAVWTHGDVCEIMDS